LGGALAGPAAALTAGAPPRAPAAAPAVAQPAAPIAGDTTAAAAETGATAGTAPLAPVTDAASADTEAAAQPETGSEQAAQPSAPAATDAGDGTPEQGQAQGLPAPETPTKDSKPQQHVAAKETPVRAGESRPDPMPSAMPDTAPNAPHATGQTQAATVASANALNAPASAQGKAHGIPSSSSAVPIEGVAVEIAARAQQGKNRFEIRLDPPELGRIDVRLDVDKEGQVSSRLVVERVETLELLRRDASQLERALQQAGLRTSDGGLEFQLRDQSFAGQRDERPHQARAQLVATDAELPVTETVQGYGRLRGLAGGLDIRV
jgi:chemotaxis protein MotD